MTFLPLPARPPGSSPRDTPRGRGLGVTTFMVLPSPSERSLERRNPLSVAPPLMGFGVPLPPAYLRASTPRSQSSLRTSDATRQFLFRSRGFTPPQRFPPRMSYGSVAHRNRSRVRRVSCTPPLPTSRRAASGTFPTTRFTPFEDFPSSAAVPHHCGRCLPAVTVLSYAASTEVEAPQPTGHRSERRAHPRSLS
jgi:hypothetical protein